MFALQPYNSTHIITHRSKGRCTVVVLYRPPQPDDVSAQSEKIANRRPITDRAAGYQTYK